MNKYIKKFLITGASLLMMASVGSGFSNLTKADGTSGTTTWWNTAQLTRKNLHRIKRLKFNHQSAEGKGVYIAIMKNGEWVYGTPSSPLGHQLRKLTTRHGNKIWWNKSRRHYGRKARRSTRRRRLRSKRYTSRRHRAKRYTIRRHKLNRNRRHKLTRNKRRVRRNYSKRKRSIKRIRRVRKPRYKKSYVKHHTYFKAKKSEANQKAEQAAKEKATLASYPSKEIQLINQDRAEHGKAPLTESPQLDKIANMRAQQMANGAPFNHKDPNNNYINYYAEDGQALGYNVQNKTMGENIDAGDDTPEDANNSLYTQEAPYDGGHYQNIISEYPNEDYTDVGVGVARNPKSEYGTYWAEDFYNRNKHNDFNNNSSSNDSEDSNDDDNNDNDVVPSYNRSESPQEEAANNAREEQYIAQEQEENRKLVRQNHQNLLNQYVDEYNQDKGLRSDFDTQTEYQNYLNRDIQNINNEKAEVQKYSN